VKIDNRQKMLVFVAIGGMALLAGDHLVIEPLIRLWKARSERITELTKLIDDGGRTLERGPILRQRWQGMLTNTLPANDAVAESKVIGAQRRWSEYSAFNVLSIKPNWRQETDDYKTYECRVDGTGAMPAVARFIYELERDPLALRVEDIEIQAKDNDGQQLALGLRFTGLVITGDKK